MGSTFCAVLLVVFKYYVSGKNLSFSLLWSNERIGTAKWPWSFQLFI